MVMKAVILLIACSSVAFALPKKVCPPKESTKCHCIDPRSGIYDCDQINSVESLQENVGALSGYFVQYLRLSSITVPTLPTHLFEGMDLKELELFRVEGEVKLGTSHFVGLEHSLSKLKLAYSFKNGRSLQYLKLDELQGLKEVFLTDSAIPKIGNDWFASGPENLYHIQCNRNGLEELGDQAFASLKNLKYLWLDHNRLKELSRSMLPSDASQLESLQFSYNMITTLPDDIFTDMPSLKDINISHNKLYTFPEDTWSRAFWNLRFLNIMGNPLRCDRDLNWICIGNPNIIRGNCALPAEKRGVSVPDFCNQ